LEEGKARKVLREEGWLGTSSLAKQGTRVLRRAPSSVRTSPRPRSHRHRRCRPASSTARAPSPGPRRTAPSLSSCLGPAPLRQGPADTRGRRRALRSPFAVARGRSQLSVVSSRLRPSGSPCTPNTHILSVSPIDNST
jgi:hypothetical protein